MEREEREWRGWCQPVFFSLDLVWCIWKVRVVCVNMTEIRYLWEKVLYLLLSFLYLCEKILNLCFLFFFPEGSFGLDFFGFSSCWGLFQNYRYWQRIGQVWNIEKQGFSFSCHCFVFFLLLGVADMRCRCEPWIRKEGDFSLSYCSFHLF